MEVLVIDMKDLLLQEQDVFYSRDSIVCEFDPNFLKYTYSCIQTNIKTRKQKSCNDIVFCRTQQDFLKLLNIWNLNSNGAHTPFTYKYFTLSILGVPVIGAKYILQCEKCGIFYTKKT